MKRAKPRDRLSIDDAILAMKVYEWSSEQIINQAILGDLDFDEKGFLERVKDEENQIQKISAYI